LFARPTPYIRLPGKKTNKSSCLVSTPCSKTSLLVANRNRIPPFHSPREAAFLKSGVLSAIQRNSLGGNNGDHDILSCARRTVRLVDVSRTDDSGPELQQNFFGALGVHTLLQRKFSGSGAPVKGSV